jgi:hypothetical protein
MKIMKNIKTGVYTHNDETFNFDFATNLSVNEKRIFVRTVVGALVDDLNYDSVLRNIIFDYTTILMFTNVDMSSLRTVDEDGKLVTDMELLEEFLLDTNIIEIVKANAFPALFDELNNAVDKSIEYRTGIHPSPIADSLASLLSTLEKKVNEFDMGSMMGMAQKFAGMTDEFNLDNLVNAYMNSDIHKKNLEEIAESKKEKTEIAENLDKAIKIVQDEAEQKAKSKKAKSKK